MATKIDPAQLIRVELELLSPFYPWAQMFDDMGYQMPFPEVMMTSDRAYALSTQITGLLMTQSWEIDNVASYYLEPVEEATHEAYRLYTAISIGSLDEAWEVIGISSDSLHRYMHLALLGWVVKHQLSGRSFREVALAEGEWMLVAQ